MSGFNGPVSGDGAMIRELSQKLDVRVCVEWNVGTLFTVRLREKGTGRELPRFERSFSGARLDIALRACREAYVAPRREFPVGIEPAPKPASRKTPGGKICRSTHTGPWSGETVRCAERAGHHDGKGNPTEHKAADGTTWDASKV